MIGTIVWDFPVQWASPYTVTYSYKTEIISSQDGTEQRRAMRLYPRRQFSHRVMSHGARAAKFQHVINYAQRSICIVPEPTDFIRITSALENGGSVVTVDDIPGWLVEGGYVALIQGPNVHVSQVSDIAGTNIALVTAADRAWKDGCKLCPAWKSLLSESLSFTVTTSTVTQGEIDFDVMPGQKEVKDAGEADFSWVFDNREVIPFKIDWVSAPSQSVSQSREIVDYGVGVVEMFSDVPFPAMVYASEYRIDGVPGANAARDFFKRHRGRQREFFFAPPAQSDMVLAADYSLTELQLTVAGRNPQLAFAGNSALRAIEIKLKNGLVHRRRVTDAAIIGNDTRLTISLDLPEIISANNLRYISWITLGRFESDDLVLDWVTDQQATTKLTVRALPYVPSEDPSGLDDGTQWLVDFYGAGFVYNVMFDALNRALNIKEPRFAEVDP